MRYVRILIARQRACWARRGYRLSICLGILLFALSLVVNHYASNYVDANARVYVPDIILDNVPVHDVDGLLNYGTLFFLLFVAGFLAWEPKRLPFVIKSVALFILIRSVFITLTHLGPAPTITPINPDNIFSQLLVGKDFFFSGHTGLPFLLAIIFWNNPTARLVSLLVSFVFGVAVLLGHLHYSIDVFSAFFISYTIYHIAQYFFKDDFRAEIA